MANESPPIITRPLPPEKSRPLLWCDWRTSGPQPGNGASGRHPTLVQMAGPGWAGEGSAFDTLYDHTGGKMAEDTGRPSDFGRQPFLSNIRSPLGTAVRKAGPGFKQPHEELAVLGLLAVPLVSGQLSLSPIRIRKGRGLRSATDLPWDLPLGMGLAAIGLLACAWGSWKAPGQTLDDRGT